MTGAMAYLRTSRDVLALPVHDSLIVPQSGVRHAGAALDSAFSYFAKVRVRWDVQCAPDLPDPRLRTRYSRSKRRGALHKAAAAQWGVWRQPGRL